MELMVRFDIRVASHRSAHERGGSVLTFSRLANGWKAVGDNEALRLLTDFSYLQPCKRHHRRHKRQFLTPNDIMDEWLKSEWTNVSLIKEFYDEAGDGRVIPMT